MGMITTTFMYACEKWHWSTNLRNFGIPMNRDTIVDFYSPHGYMWTLCIPTNFWSISNMSLSLIGMQESWWNLVDDYGIISHHDTPTHVNSIMAMRPYISQRWAKLWHIRQTLGTQMHMDHWFLWAYNPSKLFAPSHDSNTLFFFMQSPSSS